MGEAPRGQVHCQGENGGRLLGVKKGQKHQPSVSAGD